MIKNTLLICCMLFYGIHFSFSQINNLAFNKPTEQSSTSNGNASSLVVDGITDGNFSAGSVSETNNEANPWWQVDLQTNVDVGLIKIFNRIDAFENRLTNFYVFISETDMSSRNFSDIQADCSITNVFVENTVTNQLNIPVNTAGRYIRIQLGSTNVLSLAEVEVFEKTLATSNCDDFCLLDDFDNYLNGSIRGQGNWQTNPPGATDGAIISAEPGDGFSGKALMNDPNGVEFRGNAYLSLNDTAIPTNGTGTLFFQISGDDIVNSNSHFGLTDLADPPLTDDNSGSNELTDDYNIQVSLTSGQLTVQNGEITNNLTNISIENGIVYNIWLAIDNQNNSFEVYVQGGIQTLPVKAINTNGISSFAFKNETTLALQTLYLLNSPDVLATGVVYYDSFYIDKQKTNLNVPIEVSETFSFVPVENFESLNIGTLNGQDQWVSNSSSTFIEVDAENNNNKVLTINTGTMNAYYPLPRTIRNCDTGTLFFRIRRNGAVNENIGLSDVSNPSEFSDFENQINFQNDTELRVRNEDEFLSLVETFNEQWYCIWMVTNNSTNTYNLYIQGGGEVNRRLLSSGSQTDFNYRNGSASNALTTFLIKQSNSMGSFSIDDIYIDNTQENLSLPARGLLDFGEGTVDTSTPLDDPISETITTNDIGVVLEEFVTIPASDSSEPLARINFLGYANDNSNRLFVNDLRNSLYVIENGNVSTYLDVSAEFTNFADSPRLGSGFGFFAFHPEFATNGKFYTVHTESGDALNSTPDYTSFGTDDMHGIITEWTANNPEANTFSGTKREVLRIGFDTALHGFQQIGFNPNAKEGDEDYGLLYLALGDGEENPVFSGAPQDLSVPHGKILRINPLGNNSSNGNYGIPNSNPFVSNINALNEIWAYGFRNPHRFSWDTEGSNKMFIGNIGEKNIDAIYLGQKRANYGWNEREGSFLFKTDDPNNVFSLPVDDASFNYTYPTAQYDHDEGFAIVGGFVYRGKNVPSLYGKYVFGDIVKGRIFYSEEAEMTSDNQFTKIHEVIVHDEDEDETNLLDIIDAGRADLRFGRDHEGEIYVLSKQNGKIYNIKELSTSTASISNFDQPRINIYPNPVNNILLIDFNNWTSGSAQLTIYNHLGQALKTLNYNNNTEQLSVNVNDFSAGMYILKVELEDVSFVKKFIKN